MTIIWKRAAVIAAGIRGRRKAALAIASARPRPITLATVAWLKRPDLPIADRERLGKDYRPRQLPESTPGKPGRRCERRKRLTARRSFRGKSFKPAPNALSPAPCRWQTFDRLPVRGL
jgi:hypothetical protein